MENNKEINKNITDNTTISILYLNNKNIYVLEICSQLKNVFYTVSYKLLQLNNNNHNKLQTNLFISDTFIVAEA